MAATVAGGGSFFDVSKMNDTDLMQGDKARKHGASDPPPPTGTFDKPTTTSEKASTTDDPGPATGRH